jgi:pyridoxal 5'-phosphate synthase pdxT subunit
VEILAEVDGHPVAARQGNMLAVAFHTELGEDDRVHRLFLSSVAQAA